MSCGRRPPGRRRVPAFCDTRLTQRKGISSRCLDGQLRSIVAEERWILTKVRESNGTNERHERTARTKHPLVKLTVAHPIPRSTGQNELRDQTLRRNKGWAELSPCSLDQEPYATRPTEIFSPACPDHLMPQVQSKRSLDINTCRACSPEVRRLTVDISQLKDRT